MTEKIDFNEWFNTLRGDDTQAVASKKASIKESTLSRQLSRGTMRPEMVIALCRGYDRSPVTGLIETGYLAKWEAEDVGIPYALEKATNQQILDEILRRSDPEARELFTNDNHPDVIDIPDPDNLEARRERALRLANSGKAAAQKRTPRLEEPESP